MADPAPLTDDELAHWKWSWEQSPNGGLGCDDVLRLVATVEQVRRERDAAYAVIRDAMAEDGDLYGCPYFLTHMVKDVGTETCNRGCHDEPACLTSRWGHIQCPDTPEKADAIRRAQITTEADHD